MPMITPLRWDDPEAVIDGLRHVTDPVQLALDTGHAIAVHTDETAANLIQGPAEASAMAEASIIRTFSISYLKVRHPDLAERLAPINNDGMRFHLGACTLTVWKSRPTGIPYPTTRARKRIIRQESLFASVPWSNDGAPVNLVCVYKPCLEGIELKLALPSGDVEPADAPWEGKVLTRWAAVLDHPADRASDATKSDAPPQAPAADDDLPIERKSDTGREHGT